MDSSLLEALTPFFENDEISIYGTVENPLFKTRDVAIRIGDDNYRRYVMNDVNPGDVFKIPCVDSIDREQVTYAFTECGLYRYLMRSNLPGAEQFQTAVLKLLVSKRRELIDEQKLLVRLANQKIEQMEHEKSILNDERELLLENYNCDYFYGGESDANVTMVEHYIGCFIYDYKYRYFTESHDLDWKRYQVPDSFTKYDIEQADMAKMFILANENVPTQKDTPKQLEEKKDRVCLGIRKILNKYRVKRTRFTKF